MGAICSQSPLPRRVQAKQLFFLLITRSLQLCSFYAIYPISAHLSFRDIKHNSTFERLVLWALQRGSDACWSQGLLHVLSPYARRLARITSSKDTTVGTSSAPEESTSSNVSGPSFNPYATDPPPQRVQGACCDCGWHIGAELPSRCPNCYHIPGDHCQSRQLLYHSNEISNSIWTASWRHPCPDLTMDSMPDDPNDPQELYHLLSLIVPFLPFFSSYGYPILIELLKMDELLQDISYLQSQDCVSKPQWETLWRKFIPHWPELFRFSQRLPHLLSRVASSLPELPKISQYLRDTQSLNSTLQLVRQAIWQTSMLCQGSTGNSNIFYSVPDNMRSYTSTIDDTNLYKNFETSENSFKLPSLLSAALRTSNRLLWILSSIQILTSSKMIDHDLKFIFEAEKYANTVYVCSLPSDKVSALATCFHEAILSSVGEPHDRIHMTAGCRNSLSRLCHVLLRNLTEEPSLGEDNPPTNEAHIKVWEQTAELLDLIVVLNSMGHLLEDPGDMRFAQNLSPNSLVRCSPTSLACLDDMLKNRKILVLERNWSTCSGTHHKPPGDGGLRLLTDIETIDYLWGPIWEVRDEATFDVIQYNVGNGCIVPWKSPSAQQIDNARMCHWLPFKLTEEASVSTSRHLTADSTANEPLPDTGDFDSQDLESECSTDEARSWLSSSDESQSDSPDDGDEDIYTDGISAILPLAELPEPEELKAWARYAARNPLTRRDKLLIGANVRDTTLTRLKCRCSTRKFRSRLMSHQQPETIHQLGTRSLNVYHDSVSLGLSLGYKVFSLKSDMTLRSDHRYWKDALVEAWEHEPPFRHPKLLENRWGVLVSLCTRGAIRWSVLDLVWTPSIQRLLNLYRNSPAGQSVDYWDMLCDYGPGKLVEMWDKYPDRQEALGQIILLCLKKLQYTGYDTQRGVFNVLWVQRKKGNLERVALKSCNHSWVQTLRDSTISCSMAVLVEESFCITDTGKIPQFCGDPGKMEFSSRLETAIQVKSSLSPFLDCPTYPNCREKLSFVQLHLNISSHKRINHIVVLDDKLLPPGEKIWIANPEHRLAVISLLSPSHLLLEWDASLLDAAKNAFFSSPERQGHREFVHEDEIDGVEPVLVHVQSSEWGITEKIAALQLK